MWITRNHESYDVGALIDEFSAVIVSKPHHKEELNIKEVGEKPLAALQKRSHCIATIYCHESEVPAHGQMPCPNFQTIYVQDYHCAELPNVYGRNTYFPDLVRLASPR